MRQMDVAKEKAPAGGFEHATPLWKVEIKERCVAVRCGAPVTIQDQD